MAGKQRYTPDEVIQAIIAADGLLSAAARRLGCDPVTVTNYMRRYKAVAAAAKQAKEAMKDNAESELFKALREGQAWAICFFLKTQAKDRGYIERQEVTGKDGDRLVIQYVNDWRHHAADAAPGATNGHAQPGALALGGRGPAVAEDHNGNGHGG